ncbi:MAG: ribonuclease Y [Acidobacteriota bacterium]
MDASVVALVTGAVLCLIGGAVLGWLVGSRPGSADGERTGSGTGSPLDAAPGASQTRQRHALLQAREEWLRSKARLEQELRDKSREEQRIRRGLEQRDKSLRDRDLRLRSREQDLDSRDVELRKAQADLARDRERLRRRGDEINAQLGSIAGLTVEDVRQILLGNLRQEVRFEAAKMIREAREEAQRRAEVEAGKIISLAIERTASDWSAERSVCTFPLGSDKLKGRIIGHEGKNIRAFEKATGVQLLMDEQPGAVVLSCFNPIKREVGRLTLERLLRDGSINPRRIEELVARCQRRVEEQMLRAGQAALKELGINGVHPGLVRTLGRLRYRTSYGQNVLMHSIEVAKLTAIMASELRMDGSLAKRAGLFHDIGKAIDFEREGTHPEIGVEVAKRYGEHPIVVNAIGSHHEDVEVIHPISVLVSAADAISGSRPGARRKSVVDYVRRIEQLESLANEMDGVEQSYAIQAGREIRVIARPERVDDRHLALLASELARKIQSQMEYPGRIKVTVIRELRATGTAH